MSVFLCERFSQGATRVNASDRIVGKFSDLVFKISRLSLCEFIIIFLLDLRKSRNMLF